MFRCIEFLNLVEFWGKIGIFEKTEFFVLSFSQSGQKDKPDLERNFVLDASAEK